MKLCCYNPYFSEEAYFSYHGVSIGSMDHIIDEFKINDILLEKKKKYDEKEFTYFDTKIEGYYLSDEKEKSFKYKFFYDFMEVEFKIKYIYDSNYPFKIRENFLQEYGASYKYILKYPKSLYIQFNEDEEIFQSNNNKGNNEYVFTVYYDKIKKTDLGFLLDKEEYIKFQKEHELWEDDNYYFQKYFDYENELEDKLLQENFEPYYK